MATIQWRPEINALTTPQSYRPRFLPRNVAGYDEIAAEIAEEHPNYNADLIKTIMIAANEKIQDRLINGEQVTLENAFVYRPAFRARLNNSNDPLPDTKDLLQVRVFASQNFVAGVRQAARFEKLPPSKKVPVIASVKDTSLRLNNVLYSQGVLLLSGTNMSFNTAERGEGCVIEGTRDGRTSQSRFARISKSTVMIIPDIPPQTDPWNNEYTVSIHTRYTENGTLRSGIYGGKLRTPLIVAGINEPNPPSVGILTDHSPAPYVSVTNGSASADGMIRIQAVLNRYEGELLLSLLDMRENSLQGDTVRITGNEAYTLSGFPGSPVDQLVLTIHDLNGMIRMIRNSYGGRLVDILDIRQTI